MSDMEYFIKLLGAILFAAGLYLLCLYYRDLVYDDEVYDDESEPVVQEDPRLEAIRRWQSQGVLNDDGELWWVSAAKAKRRNPADDVNPPRIPPKRGRW